MTNTLNQMPEVQYPAPSNITLRLLTAAVGIPLVILLVAADWFPATQGIPLLVLSVGIAGAASEEFGRLLRRTRLKPPYWTGFLIGMLPPIMAYCYHRAVPQFLLLIITLAVLIDVLMVALSLISEVAKRPGWALLDFLVTGAGSLTIGVLFSFLIALRRSELGIWAVALAIAGVWAMDTAAYLAGRAWGSRKLAPHISPGKTVEGALAGLAAMLVVFLIFSLTPRGSAIGIGPALALGAVAAVIGQAGDLLESAFKRAVGAKDSSSLLPGHGGLLDRFDSLALAAPAFWLGLRLLGLG